MTTTQAAKIAGFVAVMIILTAVFVADDLTGVGEVLDVIEFPIMMLTGAGFGSYAFAGGLKK